MSNSNPLTDRTQIRIREDAAGTLLKPGETLEIPVAPAIAGDAGLDLVYVGKDKMIFAGESMNLYCGISVKIPDDCVGIITARSSTFTKRGLLVIQGVIDSGYTGPLYVIVYRPHRGEFDNQQGGTPICRGDKLGQLLVLKCNSCFSVVEQLPETERGSNGFGSTGI